MAATSGLARLAELLVEEGADNVADKYGLTPLHWAVQYNHARLAELLIKNKADFNAVNKNGWTILHWAAKHGHTEIAKSLIDRGADVNEVDKKGYRCTPLHWAAKESHTEIVEILIKNNADFNVVDRYGQTPLYYAAKEGHAKIVKILMDKGADPLFGDRDVRILERLIELIKNGSLKHPEKAEETQQSEDQIADEYKFLKYSLLLRENRPLIDVVGKDTFDNLICTWFADTSGLTEDQKKLNIKLLSILKDLPSFEGSCVTKLEEFLRDNKSNKDLETILNLERGESKLTVLHVLSSMDCRGKKYVDLLLSAKANPNAKDDKGRTPLYYATEYDIIRSLIKQGADPNITDIQGKTPREVAIDNHNYSVKEYLLTEEQGKLKQELGEVLNDCFFNYLTSKNKSSDLTKLKDFLNDHKNNEGFKMVLNLRNDTGKSRVFQLVRKLFRDNDTLCKEAEKLLLSAGTIDYQLGKKKCLPKSRTLWDDLMPNQQRNLKTFLGWVGRAQDMNQLKYVVDQAIKFGIRFNFPHQGKLYGNAYESKYSCMEYVIKRIKDLSKSEKNPKVASDIICKLVSIGAVLYDINSMDLINTLELEFKDHKTNMIKAYKDYVNRTLRFMEVVKSATTGKVKNAKVDNSTLYLEYSGDSTIHVAKITDGARDLGLTQGETGYGRDVIKIGKSEVEIITEDGIRDYTDLADGSDIVLTFPTSLGELEVRLYPEQNKDRIMVKVGDQEKWEKLKSCEEEIGKNCLLGGYSVYDAIKNGYFERSGKLTRSKAMGQYNGKTKEGSWGEYVKSNRALNSGREIVNIRQKG
jgi:ankyrin repeat protein